MTNKIPENWRYTKNISRTKTYRQVVKSTGKPI